MLQSTIDVPEREPTAVQERNQFLRRTAMWLGAAVAIAGPLDPEVEAAVAALEAVAWLSKYLPDILSYLDPPKTLEELQQAVANPQLGYEIHHIVEAQARSMNPLSNSSLFAARLDSSENLVRIPHWKHVEISSWYSKPNIEFGDLSPRDYLRGKSWELQYEIGLRELRDFGVLQ